MRSRFWFLAALAAGLGLTGYWTAQRLGIWGWPSQAHVRPVPPGDQEIAWIAPATSGDSWERLVAALRQMQQNGPKNRLDDALQLDLEKAFLDLTADVPEIGLSLGGPTSAKLWVRWYKLSGDNDSRHWIANLRDRRQPPLAIIGGDTSDRALALAESLREAQPSWSGPAPLLLITTATADRFLPKDQTAGMTAHEEWPKLMGIYPDRSFRFAFTNQRMVQAVLDFIRQTPRVWLPKSLEPTVSAGVIAPGHAWTSLSMLGAAGPWRPYFLYTLAWGDDGYSKDLSEMFFKQFAEQTAGRIGADGVSNVADGSVPYSTGDQFQANPRENIAVNLFLADRGGLRDQQHLLVLPTGAQRMRRFLRTLCRQAPLEIRNVVVVNGDAISFNTVYRDRDVAWNILDMPVPLVFFSHRDPIDPAAGFDPHKAATGTQDVLLYRDIFQALLGVAFQQDRSLHDADGALARLRTLRWQGQRIRLPDMNSPADGLAFFDADGDRAPGTGEHIVWLRPVYKDTRNLPQATITVWRVAGTGWQLSGAPLEVFYNRSSADGLMGE